MLKINKNINLKEYSDYNPVGPVNPWNTEGYEYDSSNFDWDKMDITNMEQMQDSYLSICALQKYSNEAMRSIGEVTNSGEKAVSNVDLGDMSTNKMCLGNCSSSLYEMVDRMGNVLNKLYIAEMESMNLYGAEGYDGIKEDYAAYLREFARNNYDDILATGGKEVFAEFLESNTDLTDPNVTLNAVANGAGLGLTTLAAMALNAGVNGELVNQIATLGILLSTAYMTNDAEGLDQALYSAWNATGAEGLFTEKTLARLGIPTDVLTFGGGMLGSIVLAFVSVGLDAFTGQYNDENGNFSWNILCSRLPQVLLESTTWTLVNGCFAPIVPEPIAAAIATYASQMSTAVFQDKDGNVDPNWCALAWGAEVIGFLGGITMVNSEAAALAAISGAALEGGAIATAIAAGIPPAAIVLACIAAGYLVVAGTKEAADFIESRREQNRREFDNNEDSYRYELDKMTDGLPPDKKQEIMDAYEDCLEFHEEHPGLVPPIAQQQALQSYFSEVEAEMIEAYSSGDMERYEELHQQQEALAELMENVNVRPGDY